ncbi:TPA: 3-oxoacyl-ACP reductase FabG [Legionella pneumophila]|uniref:3-oxoacyl-ACP reductase FabG n=1 Tax=Legionella pneumophila TaxID=446 RepID=UPI000787DC42|nr:3-oxoacyl-ACP reductase FabG [Legionella pneumophila]MDW8878846.1 3-oxoacyl-ACP reductase FabG [Legionella pneumophila subsp. fraseri]MDW8961324.1 3-oxoacyl-ACP reductase FabG [Legionella pneumophila subsp. fraseri]MDW9037108.1 3-oxoacyl-ACP reductase FabG [Legionella pneumophila subsp. fraseri]MDW9038844.1 3-oxoacyl-ACP reductase FabG [Legionella pneumophila subsp. fraseri]MDW9041692.1 3-oxoacyl-ACP reductase FabG [Legionella pneumophila subsp. fraseri]
MINLEGKIALVTGASRGIGRAVAEKLARNGAFVFGTATTEQGAVSINSFFEKEKLAGKGIVLDVTSTEQVENLMSTLSDNDQCPSILVNNAGITADNLLLRMDDEEWYKVIETNLNSIYRMTKACLKPMFRARWGRIISIGSVVGASGNSGQVNYTAAKAGVIGFSKSLAQEIGSRGITVNVVAPGFIDTDMTTALPDMVKEEMLKRIPMRKLGQPEDVADAVAFLASDSAKYITGETIHVNGGMYMS